MDSSPPFWMGNLCTHTKTGGFSRHAVQFNDIFMALSAMCPDPQPDTAPRGRKLVPDCSRFYILCLGWGCREIDSPREGPV